MAKALLGIALSLCLGLSVAQAHTARSNPTWAQLTPEQQQILAPIQGEWDKLDAVRKRKLLGIAQRYPKMTPQEQERFQERMPEWVVTLTPEQRRTAREKYKEWESEREAMRKKWDEYTQARSAEDGRKPDEPPGEAEKPAEPRTAEPPAHAGGDAPAESPPANEPAPAGAAGPQRQ